MKRLFWTLFVGTAFASFALADVELELIAGGSSLVIDNTGTIISSSGTVSGTASSSTAGVLSFNGVVGNYIVSVTTGEGSPVLPSATLDLNSINTSGPTSGPMMIEFSENNVGPSFPGWQMTWGGTLTSGAGGNVSYNAYQSNTNAFFAPTNLIGTLGPFGAGPFSGTVNGAVPGVVAPYSLTQAITLGGVGFTNYSGNASLTPMPEPVAVVLFGTVIVFSVSRLRRRRVS